MYLPVESLHTILIYISIWVMDKANHKFKHTTAVIKCDGTFSIAFLLRGGREPFEQHNKQLNIHWMLWLYIGDCCKCDLLLFARSFNSLFLLLSYYHHFFVPTVVWRFFCWCACACMFVTLSSGRKSFSYRSCMWFTVFSHNTI